MRVRRLQRLNDETREWVDEAYAYEQPDRTVRFRYNPLIWEGIGAKYNRKLKMDSTLLEQVEMVILTGNRLRWLEVEEIEGTSEEIKVALDKGCQIPQSVSVAQSLTA